MFDNMVLMFHIFEIQQHNYYTTYNTILKPWVFNKVDTTLAQIITATVRPLFYNGPCEHFIIDMVNIFYIKTLME